jgi:hypothetical protein
MASGFGAADWAAALALGAAVAANAKAMKLAASIVCGFLTCELHFNMKAYGTWRRSRRRPGRNSITLKWRKPMSQYLAMSQYSVLLLALV